jgi:hypothetical protein
MAEVEGRKPKARSIIPRARLEAMELVRIELDPSRIECVAGGNPVSLIQTLNLRRRHLSKHQQAVLNVKMLKAQRAWEKAKAKGQKRTPQVEEVSKGGRGRVNGSHLYIRSSMVAPRLT